MTARGGDAATAGLLRPEGFLLGRQRTLRGQVGDTRRPFRVGC